jgi:hypothetical protein
MTNLIVSVVVTVAGFTGIWSAPYQPAPEPAPVVTVTTEAPTVSEAPTGEAAPTVSTTLPDPCAVASLFWVDEWTVTVASVTGPEGHGFTASGIGHFVNYEHHGGPRKSVAPAYGETTLRLCP